MTKAHSLKLPLIHRLSSRALFFIVATLLVAMFSYYVYLVNKTIMNVVARERIESDISTLSSSVGALEFKYISLKNGVTLELAHAKGFQDALPTTFIDASKRPALSYNSSR